MAPGATLITDDWSGYATLGKRGYLHTAVPERGDIQVAETFLPHHASPRSIVISRYIDLMHDGVPTEKMRELTEAVAAIVGRYMALVGKMAGVGKMCSGLFHDE